nr:NADPH oxidase 5 [Microcebus murinus]
MLRRCFTWLQATRLAQVLPLGQNIQLHQLMGCVVVGLSLVHTVAHVVNFSELQAQAEVSLGQLWELQLTRRPAAQNVLGRWLRCVPLVSGIPLTACLGHAPRAELTKLPKPNLLLKPVPRRGSGSGPHPGLGDGPEPWLCCTPSPSALEVESYWTYLSYRPVWLLLILHGPGLLFFLEKAIGLTVSHLAALCTMEVNLLPTKVQGGALPHLTLRNGWQGAVIWYLLEIGNRKSVAAAPGLWRDKQNARPVQPSGSQALGRGMTGR